MRYSYVLEFKSRHPYDRDLETSWNSFLGEFVKPVADRFPDLLLWATFYGTHANFRIHSNDPDVHDMIADQIAHQPLFFDPQKEIGVTVDSDLGHPRFVDHSLGSDAITRRANLGLRFLNSTIRLYLDGLEKLPSGHWVYQRTKDFQNPEESNFESYHHLLCNMTRVPTPVYEAEVGGQRGIASLITINNLSARISKPYQLHRKIDIYF